MQQILKFKIEIFDVRNRTSISIINDTALVKSVQITRNTSLDNAAVITFIKSKAYELLPMENILKLYNYVKIELELLNYNPNSENRVWFSGFINVINKSAAFGQNPTAAVSITVVDYANLLKTTFYTKNLTFLEILNQAIPEFRVTNLSEFLGDDSKDLLSGWYSPPQLGFIFFTFLYFRFMYRIVYNDDGSSKKTQAPDSREIFKKFKIYMPFGFDLPIANGETMLKGQETQLQIYKQLQGVALDLFKYIYPEPIFEFSTYETYDSVILQIRFTPLMKFDRPVLPPRAITKGRGEETEFVSTQGSLFDVSSYGVIERYDFGHNRMKSVREAQGIAPASLLRKHLDQIGIIDTLQKTIGESKKVNIDDLIASDEESELMTDEFCNVQPLDTSYIESLNMTRSANSVVNVIWTVPTTDTAQLKVSGRELVYAFMAQRLQEVGGIDQFGNYIYQQFNPGFDANPVFLMDYRNVFGSDFVSGDMNYFGFREFEIKWNYLSTDYSTANHILKHIDRKTLEAIKAASEDKVVTRQVDEALRAVSEPLSTSSSDRYGNPREKAKMFEVISSQKFDATQTQSSHMSTIKLPKATRFRQTVSSGDYKKPSQSKKAEIIKALDDRNFKKAMERYNLSDKDLRNANKIVDILLAAKKHDTYLMGGFVSKLNGVIAEAYRENEHLYDCNITMPIDVTLWPGMIVASTNSSFKAESPKIKGYVTAVSHSIDFNAASMKTSMNISRTASDDSGVYVEAGI